MAKKPKKKHVVKYSGVGFSDKYACSCGWESNGYWDMAEAAWEEWLLHAHDTKTKVEVKHQARQKALVQDRDKRQERIRGEIDRLRRSL